MFARTATGLAALLMLTACSDADPPAPAPVDHGEIVTSTITVDDMTFDVRSAGPPDGPLVMLLHGFPQTSFEWRAQLEALGEAGYYVVAPNQRGYSPGARPSEEAAYALPLLAGDVLAMADALGHEKFHLVGHDWGAGVTWATAIFAPDRLLSVTSVSIPHPDAFNAELMDMESCQYSASSYFDFFAAEGSEDTLLADDAAILKSIYGDLEPEAIDDYLSVLGTPEALGAALDWYRANIEDRMFVGGPVGPISVPTLFIWSDGDAAICAEPAEATGDYVDAAYEFVPVSGVDHWVPENAAQQVTDSLLTHLAP